MRQPHIDDRVRLTQDIPQLSLTRGEVGIIRSTWFAPSMIFEVEFCRSGKEYQTRALLRDDQMQLEETGPWDAPDATAASQTHS